jgi:hypothetical protein
VVVDADEPDLPAGASAPLAAVAVDTVPDAFDSAEVLGIHMKQRSRLDVFMALRRIQLLLDSPDPSQAELLEVLRHGRDRHLALVGDLPASSPLPSELFDRA